MSYVAVVGAQWGDEGKGKLVDSLSSQSSVCVRYNGGSNAGHTVVVGDTKFELHLIPCGIINPHVECFLGNGMVIHIPTLLNEIKILKDKGINCENRLWISDRAHLVLDMHQKVDGKHEHFKGKDKIGTTKKGIGPAYSTKMMRNGIRVCDLLDMHIFETKFRDLANFFDPHSGDGDLKLYKFYADFFKNYIVDGVDWIHKKINAKSKILFEGANASMLDVDFGTYPYVTSSSPGANGIPSGCGISPSILGKAKIIGVVKSYTTRVGEGPFPTELLDETGKYLQKEGKEFGVTTGRPRRCGWLDLVLIEYTHKINGYKELNFTKLDILSFLDEIKIGIQYKVDGKPLSSFPASLETLSKVQVVYKTLPGWKEDISNVRIYKNLPVNAKKYIEYVEDFIGISITTVGVGPDREHILPK